MSEFMQLAIREAEKAKKKNEVPIGAVIVFENQVISRGHNSRESKQSAIMHAEIAAISKACKKLKSWRLESCDIYITKEPCLMCAGAILNARMRKVYFGVYDDKKNYNDTIYQNNLNHTVTLEGGIMEEECKKLITDFFKEKREEPRTKKL